MLAPVRFLAGPSAVAHARRLVTSRAPEAPDLASTVRAQHGRLAGPHAIKQFLINLDRAWNVRAIAALNQGVNQVFGMLEMNQYNTLFVIASVSHAFFTGPLPASASTASRRSCAWCFFQERFLIKKFYQQKLLREQAFLITQKKNANVGWHTILM
jgi:hypothetical protein